MTFQNLNFEQSQWWITPLSYNIQRISKPLVKGFNKHVTQNKM